MLNVVEETIKQARHFLDSAGSDVGVETLFFGGGTPSCLPPPERELLMRAFTDLHCREWTIESNPETLDESFLETCVRAGVTRLSVGIQSLNTRHLEVLRRHATRDHALAAIGLLRRRWGGQLNLDFITGIPGQTVSDVLDDLSVLGDSWPDHVSLYQLTVEPGTPLERMVDDGSLRLNRGEQDEELWLAGREELIRRGYQQYEVSNFCRPGKECSHNLRYWRIEPYIGAGPGAVSTLPTAWAARASSRPELAETGSPVVRFSAPKDIRAFLKGEGHFWGIETEVISPADFVLECVMMGLRLSGGIQESTLHARFGHGFSDLFPGLWEGWVFRGLALPADGALRLSEPGLLLLDRLLGELFEQRRKSFLDDLHVKWPE
jgi:oxygen-independent coproporphyrinogen III oxidase